MAYGTLTTLDTLAANATSQTVVGFGEDNIWQAVDDYFGIHNELMNEMLADFAETTTDRLRRYGGLDEMVMEDLDEFARPDAQKVTAGQTVGFPLRAFGGSLQWTRLFFMNANVQEIAKQLVSLTTADRRWVMRHLQRALFGATNYTFVDRRVDHVDIPVKRLLNADSAPIPLGPNGEIFVAASHTHYLATASLVAADIIALIDTISEHVSTGQVRLEINKAQEAAVRAMTANFFPYNDPRLIFADNVTRASGTLNLMDVGNRAIGIFDEAEVWVKARVPANYMVAFLVGGNPLVVRERAPGSNAFKLLAEDELHPLRAQSYEREFGVGVWNRAAAAVLRTNNGTYAAPNV